MELFSLILNFLLGSGVIGVAIFYSSKRRKAAAEASCAELGAKEQEFSLQKDNIEFLSSQLQESWAEIEKLQSTLNSQRDQIVELISKIKQLEIELIENHSLCRRAELSSCKRLECPDRIKNVA